MVMISLFIVAQVSVCLALYLGCFEVFIPERDEFSSACHFTTVVRAPFSVQSIPV